MHLKLLFRFDEIKYLLRKHQSAKSNIVFRSEVLYVFGLLCFLWPVYLGARSEQKTVAQFKLQTIGTSNK